MEKAVVSIALSTLRDLLLEEARFLHGVRGEVKAMETQLKEIQCLLEDADGRQHESKSVVNWVREIRDLAHRAEDAIETYAFHVSSKRGHGFKHLLRRFSCVLNEGFSLHHIGSEISNIASEVARVGKDMQGYGIRNIINEGQSSTNENQKWKRQTFPYETEDCFVGKKKELDQLVHLILDEEKEHRVVSIWGMGGIGKTTIARKVYNHSNIKRSFDSFAWVCITQKCQIRSVLEDILSQLNPQKRDGILSLSDVELIGQLCEIQKAKRCMIVVDDVWEVDHWDGLSHAFVVQGLKTKVLLTTRKQDVANLGFAFEIGLLDINDGWELLKRKAFPHGTISDFAVEENVLQNVGEEMVRKCGRLPLVISLLGGLLKTRKSFKEWEFINHNIKARLYMGVELENEKDIDGVLSLSYDDLPYYLKPCFLLMGQFKEDERISVNVVYRMWIAQGMIPHEIPQRNGATLVDVAEQYLNQLASRCIVEVQAEDDIRAEKYRSCKLHDVVRELCLSKGKREFGFKNFEYQGGNFCTLLHQTLSGTKTRHLAIRYGKRMDVQHDEITSATIENSLKQVRSLQFHNDTRGKKIEFPHSIIDVTKCKLVRVLVFKRFKFAGRKLPRGFGNLIHLRYLSLQQCELDELPSSISNMAYLYTLDLLYSKNVRIPSVLTSMTRLKHLFLPSYNIENIEKYRLRVLEEGLDDQLETLFGFNSLVHESKSITRMKNLRHFEATIHDNESLSEILNAIASNLKDLRFCAIDIKHFCKFISGSTILENLFTCPNLFNLRINVEIGKLLQERAAQIIMRSTVVRLSLFGCEIEEDPMDIFGKFPLLEDLCLLERSYVGEVMKCHAFYFPRLKNLVLKGLPNLRELRVEEGVMPIISKIHMNGCLGLDVIPDGFRFIHTLERLTITKMPKLAKRVYDGGDDFDKVSHVTSIFIVGD